MSICNLCTYEMVLSGEIYTPAALSPSAARRLSELVPEAAWACRQVWKAGSFKITVLEQDAVFVW